MGTFPLWLLPGLPGEGLNGEEEPVLHMLNGEPDGEWVSAQMCVEMMGPLPWVDLACLRAGASPGPHNRAEGTAKVQRPLQGQLGQQQCY